jgi:2-aminoadipate transaminase
VISLQRGIPSTDLIPVAQLAAAASRAVERDPSGALLYGDAAGYAPLREWFARRLGVDPARVVLTNGSLQGLSLLSEHLSTAGRHVIVEAPTYDFALRILGRATPELSLVPVREDGLDLTDLERLLRSRGPSVLYTIPTFHNPTGTTLPEAKRRDLLDLARRWDLTIVEDDPYRLLFIDGEPPPTLLSSDGDERVIHLTSLTKTVAPGLRCGAMVLPSALVDDIVDAASGTYISPGQLAQATAMAYIESGAFEPVIERSRAALHERRDAAIAALANTLDVSWSVPAGGYFLWLRLGREEARELGARAARAGVGVLPGDAFFADRSSNGHLRIAFCAAPAEAVRQGVSRLAELIRRAGPRSQAERGRPRSRTRD